MLVRQRRLPPPLVAIVLLLVLSLQFPFQESVRATELITDNFNDLDYDDWGTYGMIFNRTNSNYYPVGSVNFSAADQTLKVTGPAGNWTQQYYNTAYINHSVNSGTWSFDLFVVDNPAAEIIIHLISDHYNPHRIQSPIPVPYMNNSYIFLIFTHEGYIGSYYFRPKISFWKYEDGGLSSLTEIFVGSSSYTWTNCWTHFDITRNSTGYFNIYVNGTLRLSHQEYLTIPSGYFMFSGQSGQAIDNVAICDYIVPPPPPPETPEPPLPPPDLTPLMLAIVAIELIIIIVLLILYFRRRP